jgi:hypothetical protein
MANSYLARTPSSAGNRKTWTYSAWFKIGNVSTGAKRLFTSYDGSTASNQSTISLGGGVNHAMQIYNAPSGSSSINLTTNRLFRDCNAWYHIVVAVDTTQSTGSNRVKLYINGVQETSFSTETYGSQNEDFFINSTNLHTIGRRQDNSQYFDGYMAHVSLVDGQQLAPTVFGQTDSTSGIWKFKSPSGVTWGTNGFHLKMENSAALGTDSSGNSNTFTVNGNLKQALDTPSNVYATLNPLTNQGSYTFEHGNNSLEGNNTNAWTKAIGSTLGASSGKYYWEVKQVAGSHTDYNIFGFMKAANIMDTSSNTYSSGNQNSIQTASGNSVVVYGQSGTHASFVKIAGSLTSITDNDIVSFALDLDNRKCWLAKNGVWVDDDSGNANGSSINTNYPLWNTDDITADTVYMPCSVQYYDPKCQYNFGNGFFGTTAITSAGSNGNGSLFEYDVPSGYYALNTKNINTYG